MKKLKVLTVVGTRPEIIRLSRVIARLDEHCDHVLVHTGQNYDYELNQVFFDDLGVRKPDHFLAGRRRRAAQTIGNVIIARRPGARRRSSRTRCSCSATPTAASRSFRPSGARSRSSTWKPATGASISACPRRSTAASSTTPPTSTSPTAPSRANICCAKGAAGPRDQDRQPDVRGADALPAADRRVRRARAPRARGRSSYFVVSAHREENIDATAHVLPSWSRCSTAVAEDYGLPVIVSTHPRTQKRIESAGVAFPRQRAAAEAARLPRLREAADDRRARCCRTAARSARSRRSSTSRR